MGPVSSTRKPVEYQSPPGLLRFDIGRPNHLGPLLNFLGHEGAEFGGRAPERSAAQVGKPRLQPRVGEADIDFSVELFNDLGWGRFRCSDAEPDARFVTGTNSAIVGTSGSASERVAVVTASARSRPARICSSDDGRLSNMT